ncbi:outer membrane beta-barrel protein [Zooshikella harenae]|uniref:Outer membrane beta-barrel protein n=1 Tax=Zooshikella harenae TaxID=2827238 RepID=A0ABS5ZBK2_9GAMM|nr:outer membrane beta-barrel protein [Zooshikella harenae]MBU2711355.1 outer membrane beta-barrel protein [Zooshikella harenae]
MKKTLLGLLIAPCLIAPAVNADDVFSLPKREGFYVGGGYGLAKYQDGCDGVDSSISSSITDCDRKDQGYKAFAGYRFNDFFALQGGYYDLGKATADAENGYKGSWETGHGSREIKGYALQLVTLYPADEYLDIKAMIGAFHWQSDTSATGYSVNHAVFSYDNNERGTDLMYGVGVNIHLTNQLSLGLDYERFNNIGDDRYVEGDDVDFISGSVQYTF